MLVFGRFSWYTALQSAARAASILACTLLHCKLWCAMPVWTFARQNLICSRSFSRLPAIFAIHISFSDHVSVCKNSAPSTDGSGFTGVHRSEAAIPANVDHMLAIFLYHFSSMHGFTASLAWIGPFNSIKFNASLRRIGNHFSFQSNASPSFNSIQRIVRPVN